MVRLLGSAAIGDDYPVPVRTSADWI